MLALAGCDSVFGLFRVELPIDASIDAQQCTNPIVSDDFELAGPPCGTWGMVQGTASSVTRSGGALVITPPTGVKVSAGCKTSSLMPFTAGGVFVKVPTVEIANGYSDLQVITYTTINDATFNANTGLSAMQFSVGLIDQESCIVGPCFYYAEGPYSADEMLWWRVAPTNDGHTLTASFAADGVHWIEFGHRDLLPPALAAYVQTALIGGNVGGTSAPGMTEFDSFNICPP